MTGESENLGGEKTLSIGEVILSADWRVTVGLAFAQMWITTRWFCLSDFSFDAGESALQLTASSCLIATVILLTCALFSVKTDSLLGSREWSLTVGSLALVSALFVPARMLAEKFPEVWALAGGVISGIGSSLLMLTWFFECVKNKNMIELPLSFLCAAALICGVTLASDLLPQGAYFGILFNVVPVVCSTALLVIRSFAGDSDRRAVESSERSSANLPTIPKRVARYFAKTCGGALLVGLANELIRCVSTGGPVLFSSNLSSYWVSVVVLALVSLGVARQLASNKPSGFYFVCRGAMVLSIVGALLYPYAGAAETFMISLSAAGRQCVQILIWVVVFQLCLKFRTSVSRLFGVMCGVWYLGSFSGMLLHRSAGWDVILQSAYGTEMVSVSAVLLLVLAFGMVFSERDSALVFEREMGPKWHAKAFTRGCDRLIEQGGLTKRESDVLRLLAKGASVATIEEKLYISSSTVSTHMKHIYQKLDVHSRKELFDLVEATAVQCAAEQADDCLKSTPSD